MVEQWTCHHRRSSTPSPPSPPPPPPDACVSPLGENATSRDNVPCAEIQDFDYCTKPCLWTRGNPPTPPNPPPAVVDPRMVEMVEEADLTEMPASPEPTEWMNTTPLDTEPLGELWFPSFFFAPDLDDHAGPWSDAPSEHHRSRRMVSRDSRL